MPFFTLLNQSLHFSLWFPVAINGCFLFLKEGINFSKYYRQGFLKKPESLILSASNAEPKKTILFRNKVVLLSGVNTGIGKAWIEHLSDELPQHVLLMDDDLIALEAIKNQLHQRHPCLKIDLFSSSLPFSVIQSVFKTYQPSIVLDCNRYFQVPSVEEGLAYFTKRNLLLPYWLAKAAHQSAATLMISMHPLLIKEPPFLKKPQQILKDALQRYDSSQLRVINLQFPLCQEQIDFLSYLSLGRKAMQEVFYVSGQILLQDICSLSRQLISHPIHQGAVWTPLYVKRIKGEQLEKVLAKKDSFQQKDIQHIPETSTPLKISQLTSHARLAIVKEDFCLTHDADPYFLKLEQEVQKNPQHLETFFAVGS